MVSVKILRRYLQRVIDVITSTSTDNRVSPNLIKSAMVVDNHEIYTIPDLKVSMNSYCISHDWPLYKYSYKPIIIITGSFNVLCSRHLLKDKSIYAYERKDVAVLPFCLLMIFTSLTFFLKAGILWCICYYLHLSQGFLLVLHLLNQWWIPTLSFRIVILA